MEEELDNFSKQGITLEVSINELNQKLTSSEHQLIVERSHTRNYMVQLDRLKTDVHNCAGLIQEPKRLKEAIVAIFHKYAVSNEETLIHVDTDVTAEFDKHRRHLERTVKSMTRKIQKNTEIHRSDYIRIMRENVSLITEINELRRELKLARTHNHDLEATMRLTRKEGATARELLESIKANKHNPVLEKDMKEAQHIIASQRATIGRLHEKLDQQQVKLTITTSGASMGRDDQVTMDQLGVLSPDITNTGGVPKPPVLPAIKN